MKPISPHDPRNEEFDDLIAAALHGELTPDERAQFESRIRNDPAAQAAYQEAQAMHDLLEKTHKSAQPDPAFEQRMVSAVRRKLQHEQHRETALESLLVLWAMLRKAFRPRFLYVYGGLCSVMLVLFLGFVIYSGNQVKGVFTTITSQLAMAGNSEVMMGNTPATMTFNAANARVAQLEKKEESLQSQLKTNPYDQNVAKQLAHIEAQKQRYASSDTILDSSQQLMQVDKKWAEAVTPSGSAIVMGSGSVSGTSTFAGGTTIANGGTISLNGGAMTVHAPSAFNAPDNSPDSAAPASPPAAPGATASQQLARMDADKAKQEQSENDVSAESPADSSAPPTVTTKSGEQGVEEAVRVFPIAKAVHSSAVVSDGQVTVTGRLESGVPGVPATTPVAPAAPAAVDDRKLIRNAQLDLEVKSFQSAMDQIVVLTKAAGGYVDTSNSQKGGNGKLQGTVVVKVLPQNLDAFLLKLRDLGQVNNQSVSTDDVTKDYFDTQARLENSRRMEEQLQDLLKHANSKVSDLLQVERELGRVRGEIEQMQGQLKLYDFQVQYATVTMQMREKDINQTAAYLLKEQDEFSLFATDVEATFQKARAAADEFKTQVLVANLIHNSGSDVAAELTVMVAPDQIEPFLAQVRSLGRVANFTRQTQRVAKDGGDSDQPADETLTEKDKVQVHLSIRSDDETRKQVALTVVAKAVDDALDQAKAAVLANAGVEILNSSLNKTPQGQSTAELSVRVPGKDYSALMESFRGLGRTSSLSIQRNDNSGPGANGDDAPVIITLALTDDDTPLQETEMSVLASDVDSQAQQIKKDATDAGVEVKASSFERQPDGTELAQMTFRLPISKYAAFLASVKNLGKVESLTVRRDDRPDQTRTDDTAPAEINLQLHNQGDIVAEDHGLWATLRQTFGEGAGALFGSVRVIGVVIAFLTPWAFTLVLLAWFGRRIYVWRQK